uniref:Essential MCU regulator, mitochondrial n=1 Tax=Rattus norvegicus TaxID=10116 RepID=A0A8I6AG11_RAT
MASQTSLDISQRLAWVSVQPGALWSGPRGRRSGNVYTVPGSSGLSQVPSSSVILPKPVEMSFGLLCVFSIVISFLYIGILISKIFAAPLEELDIFVPEDDDEDGD